MLVAAAVVVSLGYGIVAPVLPQFAKSFGVTTTAATVVVSAFAFMRLIFAPASGRLSNLFGERWMYVIGIAMVATSSAASGFAQSYWQLLVFRGLGGIGSVTFTVAAMSLIFKLAPPEGRGRASAAYGSGFLLGNICGPAVGALIAPLGYRWPFWIYAILLGVAATIVFVMVPANVSGGTRTHSGESNTREARTSRGTTDAKPGHTSGNTSRNRRDTANNADTIRSEQTPARESARSQTPMTIREALAVRRFKVVLLTAFAQGWTNMGVRVAVVPLLAASISGAPGWLPGAALMFFAAGNGLALTRAGYFSDVYGRKPIVVVGLIISGIFTVIMGLWDVSAVVLIGSFFGGFGSGCIQPSQQGTVADIVGNRPGSQVVSFFQQSGDFGQILGPIVAGLMIDYSGYALAYGFSGAILLAVALVWIFLVKEPTRRRRA
ncbi:Multidrug-efflux transporter 3 [Trueperella bialowiezensis]|uniref:Multidrug-efflux transporter 3 n=1 Tax=Trueperella bialowiezensis TaxID=312285 RepID=A0A448PF17_9ACTO|nr:Multidrug-efflux transporter 3 [Trueperella bialowiezensis]